MSNQGPEFDKEAVYDAEIFPLMAKILDICKREEIPMIASFCYKNETDGASYCTSSMPGKERWQPPEFRSSLSLIRSGFTSFAIATMKQS